MIHVPDPRVTMCHYPHPAGDYCPGCVEEIDRNARAYGYEVGLIVAATGQLELLPAIVDHTDDNPFLDRKWRDRVQNREETIENDR